jgi:signal transduction histidine kinase/PAS domain-containing protein
MAAGEPAGAPEGDLKLTEERLSRVSVLQELTVAAVDLFDPRRSMDDFLDRLAMRLGCAAVLALEAGDDGGARLLGAAGLARASRRLEVTWPPDSEEPAAKLPYPELAREHLVRWQFQLAARGGERKGGACWLLLYFEGGPRVPALYHGVVERLADILRTALLHRSLYARTIDSERRLWEQKTLLESQSEASLDGILFVGDGGQVSTNRRFREFFGLAEKPPTTIAEAFQAVARLSADPTAPAARLERLVGLRDERGASELVLTDARVLDVSCVPVKGQEGLYYGRAWYFRDITERKRSEEERARLLEKEQAARAAAEDAQRRTAFLADASRLLATSLDYAATLERVAHLAIPALADWCVVDIVEEDHAVHRVAVTHVNPERTDAAHRMRTLYPVNPNGPAGIPRALRSGRSEFLPRVTDEELKRIALDEGHYALLREMGISSLIVVPMSARGRRLGAISLVYGESGRRYGVSDLALAEDLALRAAQAVDNARLHLRVQEAVRARDEFLSIASHELRTPITSLQLAAQGLLRLARNVPIERAPPSFVLSSLDTAVRQSARMSALIDRLLDVSRIQSGRLELQLEEVDLAAVAREMVVQSQAEVASAGSRVDLKAEGAALGRWDKARLEQVVSNLLSNAIKYGAGKPIEIAVEADGTTARLTVADHGIGIARDRMPRIFERFERAVSSRHYSGLGLGLYIVRRVLEALGGSVRVHSVEGEGATFVVELPQRGPGGAEDPAQPEKRGAA